MVIPFFSDSHITLYHGDNVEVLRGMEPDSVDAVVTDPPYGLEFMGKRWDYDVPGVGLWREVLRVLKPGGHMLAFGGTRTYHRMVVNIEDAGFEIRDMLQWLYGSGFPKSLDISKAIDKAAGHWRGRAGEVIGPSTAMSGPHYERSDKGEAVTAAAAAAAWAGWGTALKPANEPICLARKPISENNIAANVLRWGTGGLNIDASRIGDELRYNRAAGNTGHEPVPCAPMRNVNYKGCEAIGRFPSNVLLDEEAAGMLGDVARFFYVAKASVAEREEGIEGTTRNGCYGDGIGDTPKVNGERPNKVMNHHPTVKPVRLMEYLVRMVTPPGGIVLDPFAGSGTTGKAAKRMNLKAILIEREEDYSKIAAARQDRQGVLL